MSGISVTIYNDDEFGRDFQVVKLNTLSGQRIEHRVQKPGKDGGGESASYEICAGEMLLIVPTGT